MARPSPTEIELRTATQDFLNPLHVGAEPDNQSTDNATDNATAPNRPPTTFQQRRRFVRTCIEFPTSSRSAFAYALLSFLLIGLSATFTVTGTLNDNGYIFGQNLFPHQYDYFHIVFTVFFSLDLIVRCFVADSYLFYYQDKHNNHHSAYDIITKTECKPFFRDIFTLFDFLSVCPLLIKQLFRQLYLYSPPYKVISLLVVFRIVRIVTATRHHNISKIMSRTVTNSAEAILMLLLMYVCFLCV